MKFFVVLLVLSSLSMNAMDEDKKVSGGISKSRKEQLAKLTMFDCPVGYNSHAWLEHIKSEKKSRNSFCVLSEKSNSGHMNF